MKPLLQGLNALGIFQGVAKNTKQNLPEIKHAHGIE